MATQRGVRRDAFIKSVRPDPKSTEELVLLQGYIGDSDLDGHVRVYSDATLSDFIDLPEQDVLYSDPVEPAEDSLGGSRLWVKKTTVFTAGDPRHANRVKSSFLEGDLVKAFGNQGGKVPTAVVRLGDIASDFVVTGCGPITEKFEGCGISIAGCTVVQPPLTVPSDCFKQTCVQPTCQINCNVSRHPFAICISVNNVTCQVDPGDTIPPLQTRFRSCVAVCFSRNNVTCQADPGFNAAVQQQFGAATTGYTGGFNPYQTANYGY